MLYRKLLHLFLLLAAVGVTAQAQPDPESPVTLSEIRSILTRAERTAGLVERTNKELIAAIERRGVDFVLTPEEEWVLRLREASDELIAAIRNAIDPAEREFRLNVRRQQDLYNAFATNYNRSDLAGRQTALNAAREFVGTYADDPNVAEIVTFMKRNLPRLEQSVAILQQRDAAIRQAQSQSAERELQREQQRAARDAQRAERDRQRQETAAAAKAAAQPTPASPPSNKSPQPTQPTDNPRPIFPITRKP